MNSGLQPEIIRGKYSITRYGESFIEVNEVLITSSCIISTDDEPIPWQITNVDQLSKQEIGKLFQNNPDDALQLYAGSVIFVPRGIDDSATNRLAAQAYVSILGNIGIALASLSSINNNN